MKKIIAVLVGIINSAIGAGGGLISVPTMIKSGLTQKQAQATTLAVILPLTIISTLIYAFSGEFSPIETFRYIPFGVIGAVIGTRIAEKADNKLLKKLFALFMIWSGIRMILR